MKQNAFSILLFALGSTVMNGAVKAADLPTPWHHQDIGDVTVLGGATAADGVFTLKGTLDIWGKSDGCHFAWQAMKGDVTIIARVLSVELSGHSKGDLAIRESLDARSRHATMVDTPADGCQFLVRSETGDVTTVQEPNNVAYPILPINPSK